MKITNILQAFLLVLVLLCSKLAAQTPGKLCPNPTAPYDQSSSGAFDWTQDYYPFYLNDGPWDNGSFKSMPSPWIDFPNNLNLSSFQFTQKADYAPEYGWVLVKKDFGAVGRNITHPYMILYNRFRGTMRIFVAITKQQPSAAQKCVFKVEFLGAPSPTRYKSGIFEFNRAGNYFNALDNFDNQIPTMKTTNRYANALPYWVYTDIATAYDPCTCIYTPIISFDVDLINTTTLQFTANGNIVQQIDNTGVGGGGRQNLLQIGTSAVKAGTSYHGIATNGLSTINSIFGTNNSSPAGAFIKNWVPGLGAAVGVLDFLSSAFGAITPPQPMAFKMNMQANGELNTILPHKEQAVDLPGSSSIRPRNIIPLSYDIPLGVYNLLETPKLGMNVTDVTFTQASFEVKLLEHVKYILNPNAEIDLNKFDIYGALELQTVPVSENPLGGGDIVLLSPNFYKVTDVINANPSENTRIWRSTTYPLKALKDVVIKYRASLTFQARWFIRLTLKHKRSIVVKDTPTEEMEEINISRYLASITNANGDASFNLPNKVELQEMKDELVVDCLNNPINIPAGTTKTIYASTKLTINNLYIVGGGILRIMTGTPHPNISSGTMPYFETNASGALDFYEQNGQILYEVGVPDLIKGLLLPVSDSKNATPVTNFCNNSVYINRAKNFEANKDENLSTSVVESSAPKSDNLSIYPNPTATDATFSYAIAKAGATKITVTNMLGIVVSELVHVENHEIGSFEVNLNTQNLPSGIYLCVLQTVEGVQTQKLVVNK